MELIIDMNKLDLSKLYDSHRSTKLSYITDKEEMNGNELNDILSILIYFTTEYNDRSISPSAKTLKWDNKHPIGDNSTDTFYHCNFISDLKIWDVYFKDEWQSTLQFDIYEKISSYTEPTKIGKLETSRKFDLYRLKDQKIVLKFASAIKNNVISSIKNMTDNIESILGKTFTVSNGYIIEFLGRNETIENTFVGLFRSDTFGNQYITLNEDGIIIIDTKNFKVGDYLIEPINVKTTNRFIQPTSIIPRLNIPYLTTNGMIVILEEKESHKYDDSAFKYHGTLYDCEGTKIRHKTYTRGQGEWRNIGVGESDFQLLIEIDENSYNYNFAKLALNAKCKADYEQEKREKANKRYWEDIKRNSPEIERPEPRVSRREQLYKEWNTLDSYLADVGEFEEYYEKHK